MVVKFVTVEEEYSKNRSIRKEDAQNLLEWSEKQRHLPNISGWYYNYNLFTIPSSLSFILNKKTTQGHKMKFLRTLS